MSAYRRPFLLLTRERYQTANRNLPWVTAGISIDGREFLRLNDLRRLPT
jgi:hypothetical protein